MFSFPPTFSNLLTLLLWIVVACLTGAILAMVRQYGQILLRLEALEAAAQANASAQLPQRSALLVGAAAPNFELPDLLGVRRALAQWRGQALLMIFYNPEVAACRDLLAALVEMEANGSEAHPLPLLISTGSVERNRRLVAEQQFRSPVLLQRDMEIAALYQTNTAPSGYLVDAAGNIVSELAIGVVRLLVLASMNVHNLEVAPMLPPVERNALPAVSHDLPLGAPAPEFHLPDLTGDYKSLKNWRGQRVLLTFFNLQCGYCTEMAEDLAALCCEVETDKLRPLPVIIATGDRAANQEYFAAHKIRCPVLLQREMEVASAYAAHGTPMGYLIDEQGRIASELAVGAPMLLDLAEPQINSEAPRPPAAAVAPAPGASADGDLAGAERNGHDSASAKGNKSVAGSRIQRDGLKAGTTAPAFRLPRLGGGEVALEDYRGQRVLLVFSDPGCGPCMQLAPQLQQLAGQRPDIQILIVSRGDAAANQAKVEEYGLTFPVALQKQWEISRLYAMFATPIGYLVNEDGVLVADVAVGVEPILGLLQGAVALAQT